MEEHLTRDGLDRLTAFLYDRVPTTACRGNGHHGTAPHVEPRRRSIELAVAGIEAYLQLAELHDGGRPHRWPGLDQARTHAEALWTDLEDLASQWSAQPSPSPEPSGG
ncbi:hypothetical protein [Kitasatospora camelliae]|uniref:SAV-6107-like HEPN domain-containing protein n=1 Tax=Kitasatospora camelliae TaxID=3156397 RepID=A0AAU8JR34_9ACTN